MEHLQTLHRESQTEGRLRTVGWYVKSIATKEFILPAMLIVLDLHYDNLAEKSGLPEDAEGAFRWTPEQRAKMVSSLEDAAVIWKSLADGSVEAFKASKTIDIMLQKLQDPTQHSNDPSSKQMDTFPTTATNPELDPAFASLGTGTIPPQGFGDLGNGESPFTNINSSAFMGMEFSLPAPNLADFAGDGMNFMGAQSPLSMFTNIGASSGSGPDLTTNFDWVCLPFA
jgi:hypothetical protein